MAKYMNIDDFNKKFGGILDLKFTKEPVLISPNMYNTTGAPGAKIKSVKFDAYVNLEDEHGEYDQRKPTKAELDSVVLKQPSLKMSGRANVDVEHKAPNKKYFTARDLIAAIRETERQTRSQTVWFGGIDTHHVYFEGLHIEGGAYHIFWGS
jgi:hypothetical protein